jgi:hypothetical protein
VEALRTTDFANAALGAFVLGFLIAAFSVIWWAPDVGEQVDPPGNRPLRQGDDGGSLCRAAVKAGVDFHRPAARRPDAPAQDKRPWPTDPSWPLAPLARPGGATQWAQLRPLADLQSSTRDLLHDTHQHGSEPLSYRLN